MDYRDLRERLRHAGRNHRPKRIGKRPLISLAVIGTAAMAAVPAIQSMDSTEAPDKAAMVEASDVPGLTVPGQKRPDTTTGEAATSGGAATPNASKSTETTTAEQKAKQKAKQKAEVKKAAPAKLELYYQYGVQTTGWYCGPAAARMALSARGIYPSQDALAAQLGTTVNGTNSSADIARVLNAVTKTSNYQATSIPSKSVTKQQVEKLRADVVDAVSHGYPVVMNTVGIGQDVNGNTYSFPGGHYITVVGYRDNGTKVKIGDSANPNSASYWMTTSNLANWAGTRGYAS
jgi:Peptidase_C39 like family